MLVPWIINLADAGLVARTEGIIVAIKLGILAVVIVAGVPTVSAERLEPATWPNLLAIVAAGMLIFVAYEGFELIANASTEVRRPRRTLPLAFVPSVGLVVILYVAISVVVVGSLSPEEIVMTADFALAQAAEASLGQVEFTMVAISAILATFSAIHATLYGAARLSFTIASEGELPRELTTLRWNQPIGLHITMVAGLTMAVDLQLTNIASLSSAIFLIVFAVVNAAAFKAAREIKASRMVAGLGVVGCVGSFLVLIAQAATQDIVSLASLAALLGGALGLEHPNLEYRRKERIATEGLSD